MTDFFRVIHEIEAGLDEKWQKGLTLQNFNSRYEASKQDFISGVTMDESRHKQLWRGYYQKLHSAQSSERAITFYEEMFSNCTTLQQFENTYLRKGMPSDLDICGTNADICIRILTELHGTGQITEDILFNQQELIEKGRPMFATIESKDQLETTMLALKKRTIIGLLISKKEFYGAMEGLFIELN